MRRGQVWVETVIYTLIGLSLIGLVLALVTPKINEYRDRSVIEQTISSLNLLDSKINEVAEAPGSVRVVDFLLRKGSLYFNSSSDSITYVLEDSKSSYSEPGQPVQIGRITVVTTKQSKSSTVNLTLNYNYDLDYDNNETIKILQTATVPYRLSFANKGFSTGANGVRPHVFFSELSGA